MTVEELLPDRPLTVPEAHSLARADNLFAVDAIEACPSGGVVGLLLFRTDGVVLGYGYAPGRHGWELVDQSDLDELGESASGVREALAEYRRKAEGCP